MTITLEQLAKDRLLHEMCEISENWWCAGWIGGLEYILWDEITGCPAPPNDWDGCISEHFKEELVIIKELSDLVNGWFYHKEYVNNVGGPTFISLDEWKAMYRKHALNKLTQLSRDLGLYK